MANASDSTLFGRIDRVRLQLIADCLAVATVISLPWSTSATAILIVVWLVAFALTHNIAQIREELKTPAGGLPALLWLLAALGMLWASASPIERFDGIGGFHKLLIIPLLLTHFRHSERGMWAVYGFAASCTALLAASWFAYAVWLLVPQAGFYVTGKLPGILVKDYIAQSSEFFICAFALLPFAFERARRRQWVVTAVLAILAMLFLANIAVIALARTALIVIPLLVIIFGYRHFGWKGVVSACLAGAIVCAIAWMSSPMLRARVAGSFQDVTQYGENRDAPLTSSGIRLELWKKSLQFVAEAPIIGHGTGSIPEMFRRAAAGQTGTSALVSVNPHNQYFYVAIQLGLVGLAVLIAMWSAHLALFRGGGHIAWIGTVFVVQNLVSSFFNSHLTDFFHGWLYVFGVGVLGGMMQRQASRTET